MGTKPIVHYGLTREEFAAKAGKHPSCFTVRLRPLCNNGSFHAFSTRSKPAVTCEPCRKQLDLELSKELREFAISGRISSDSYYTALHHRETTRNDSDSLRRIMHSNGKPRDVERVTDLADLLAQLWEKP